MFSTVVTYAAFGITSIIFLAVILDAIINRKYNEKVAKIYQLAGQSSPTYLNMKMFIFLCIWVASGVYIWG